MPVTSQQFLVIQYQMPFAHRIGIATKPQSPMTANLSGRKISFTRSSRLSWLPLSISRKYLENEKDEKQGERGKEQQQEVVDVE